MTDEYKILRQIFMVNWTTLSIGWYGVAGGHKFISVDDVKDHAVRILQYTSDSAMMMLLTDIINSNESSMGKLLDQMGALFPRDYQLEQRKWRAVMLMKMLVNTPHDPIYGLTMLTDFWSQFGFPPESPHVMQGVDNAISPEQYYSQHMLDRLLKEHASWLENECVTIKQADERQHPDQFIDGPKQ